MVGSTTKSNADHGDMALVYKGVICCLYFPVIGEGALRTPKLFNVHDLRSCPARTAWWFASRGDWDGPIPGRLRQSKVRPGFLATQ